MPCILGLLSVLSTALHLLFVDATILKEARDQQRIFQSHSSSSSSPSASSFDLSNLNQTANFVFNSAAGVLAQLPSTLHPNGHLLLPVTVPPHTTLYHGREDNITLESGVEWFAFDPELSMTFASEGAQTWLSTYASTRELKLVLFDGMSAPLLGEGWLDVQDALAPREGPPNPKGLLEDYARALRLCGWNEKEKLGLDGFVRMKSGFEIIWCDFTSDALELLSHYDVSPPDTHTSLPSLMPPTNRTSPFATPLMSEWLRVVTHRSLVPQPHVVPDWSSLVTFYHPRLTSLLDARRTNNLTRMADHQVLRDASRRDIASLRSEAVEVLRRPQGGSGVNWGQLAKDVVERYGDRLAHLNLTLSSNLNSTALVRKQVSLLTYTMLNPYLDTTHLANTSDASVPSSLWLPQAVERCSNQLTRTVPLSLLTPQEKLLKSSIELVSNRICVDMGSMFAESLAKNKEAAEEQMVDRWRGKVRRLMEWLDWPMWVRCEETCAWNQVCAFRVWPAYFPIEEMGTPNVPFCKDVGGVV